jgi:hypothetical protein
MQSSKELSAAQVEKLVPTQSAASNLHRELNPISTLAVMFFDRSVKFM